MIHPKTPFFSGVSFFLAEHPIRECQRMYIRVR